MRHQQLAELGELGEAQHPVALGEDLVEDLLEPDDLARAAADGRAVVQQLGRVVADLLELGHRGQHVAAPLDALGVLDLLHHVVDDGLVERGLLGGEPVVLLDLDLLGQVVDDGRVGLDPAQQVGPGDRAQPLRRLGLRRAARPGSRSGRGSARRMPSRPGLRKSMIDHSSASRFSTGVPVSATRCSARIRRTALAARDRLFLTACASSSTSRRHS